MKILIVDAEKVIQVLFEQRFRKEIRNGEVEFAFAYSGEEALQCLEKYKHEAVLILSDINMPGMSGLDLLKQMEGKYHAPPPVVMMITAYGDAENYQRAMELGADDFITKPVDFNDLELTIEKTLKYVRQMRETLKAIKENNILKMYVDEEVLNFMDTKEFESSLMANETVEASIVFIDICNFTSISENESPDTFVKLLNSYFDVTVKKIIEHGGFIDKFIGDAIRAVFRGEYHLDRAIESCLTVRTEIDKLPPVTHHVTYKPNVSIGINSVEVVSGNNGSASLKRLDYTVIGDVVNTAQRLQSAARPGQIIISEASYGKVKEFFNCRHIGEVKMKNKQYPMVIYEVLA